MEEIYYALNPWWEGKTTIRIIPLWKFLLKEKQI